MLIDFVVTSKNVLTHETRNALTITVSKAVRDNKFNVDGTDLSAATPVIVTLDGNDIQVGKYMYI